MNDTEPMTKAKERKPISGEKAFQNTDEKKHQKIITYVNARKNDYFNSPDYKAYMKKVGTAKALINQDTRDLDTRFKMRFAIMRAGYDNLIDSLDDLFDVNDLVTCQADGNKTIEFASDWQKYTNRLLRSCHYHEHLSERFLYLPDYGWSTANDFYQFSDGWQVKAQAKTILPGMEAFDFGMEMDVLMDKPQSEIVRPDQWFGSIEHGRNQPFQGTLKRWYLKDVYSAMIRKDKSGNPLYNLPELEKIAKLMEKGWQDTDEFMKMKEDMGPISKDVEFKGDKGRGPYVDIIRFHGPLNDITDSELSKDPNEYYVECTRTCLLRWQENPRDKFTTYTHARSHPYRNNPFSRSYLDAMLPHQQFGDFLACMSAESIVDNLTKHWAYWEEDMLDPGDFTSPKGLNAFIILQDKGRLPTIVGQERSGAFSDVKDILMLFDRDRQRAGVTDQEQGAQGGGQDATATAARILASASSKKVRAMVKRMCRQCVVPQIKNLVMLSLVHGKPENFKFLTEDGQEKRMSGEHLKWWMQSFTTDTQVMISDTITRDRNEEAMKATTFFQYATQLAGQLNPDVLARVLRMSAELGGINQAMIDQIVPEPLPVDITTPDGKTVRMPSAMGMPSAPPQPGAPGQTAPPTPAPQGGNNATVAPPNFG